MQAMQANRHLGAKRSTTDNISLSSCYAHRRKRQSTSEATFTDSTGASRSNESVLLPKNVQKALWRISQSLRYAPHKSKVVSNLNEFKWQVCISGELACGLHVPHALVLSAPAGLSGQMEHRCMPSFGLSCSATSQALALLYWDSHEQLLPYICGENMPSLARFRLDLFKDVQICKRHQSVCTLSSAVGFHHLKCRYGEEIAILARSHLDIYVFRTFSSLNSTHPTPGS